MKPKMILEAPQTTQVTSSPPFFQTNLPDGTPWLEIYRVKTDILVRFPGYADFLVEEKGSTVRCTPSPCINQGTLDHLYHNQVIPLIMSSNGRPVFHASAIEIDGVAIAFVGESGRGKSTLAASFAQHGHGFLTDDSIVLNYTQGTYSISPGVPSIRLWQDSKESVLSDTALCSVDEVSYTDKLRILADDQLPFCNEPRTLSCIFYLGDGSSDKTTIKAIPGHDALLQLLKHSFVLDVQDKKGLELQFEHIARLSNMPMHFQLDYPRSYRTLSGLRDSVLEHVSRVCLA